MDKIANASQSERASIFEDVADKIGSTAFIVEKDFWVSWTLWRIFADERLCRMLCFKGGTSLSKVFKLIERFSEDIDLILSMSAILREGEKVEQPSKTKQETFNKEIEKRAEQFIAIELREYIASALRGICSVDASKSDGHILLVRYPRIFDSSYINPEVKLEIGPLALWDPNEKYPISSYVADAYPTLNLPTPLIPTIKAERTFWEKATILHHEYHRPSESPIQARYSRHYYDVYKIGRSIVKDEALKRLDLLTEVVAFKKRFYPRKWARYDEALDGALRLCPSEHYSQTLERDYSEMGNMIFGDIPSWQEIANYLCVLEKEINEVMMTHLKRFP